MTSSASPTCMTCGAPDPGDRVICRFCQHPVSAEAQAQAIPCPNPKCRIPNRWGKQHCIECRSWLVVQCVFCGGLSPHNLSNCLQCNEAFAGAPQRKAQLEQQRQHQQTMDAVSTYGGLAANVGSGLLGGLAGGVLGSMLDGGSSSSWSSDSSADGITGESGMSDDASFDWSGGDGGSSDDF